MLTFDKIKATSQDSYAMVMFHGWGGNKESLKPLLNIFTFNKHVSFYLIQAPYLLKKDSYSWSYEISPGVFEREKPRILIDNFFNEVIFKNYLSSNIFLLGFSQGAYICFEYGLSLNRKMGGIFPIAGFTEKKPAFNKAQIDTPLFIGHGIDDKVIDKSSSENAYNYYFNRKKMNNVDLIMYKGGHKIGFKYLKAVNSLMNINNIK